MNIFYTDTNPVSSAQALDDRRLNKMVLETAQILNTVARVRCGLDVPYKPTHESHPCVRWAGANRWNFQWLMEHGIALSAEYTFRRGRLHGAFKPMIEAHQALDFLTALGNVEPPPNCTTFKRVLDTANAYRHYLNWKWMSDTRPPAWTRRGCPFWYTPTPMMEPDYAVEL